MKIVVANLPFHGTDRDLAVIQGLPNVEVIKLSPEQFGRGVNGAKLLILPGSSHTTRDLEVLRANGGEQMIHSHLAQGGFVLGICGGMQWMCEKLDDPLLTQGEQTSVDGIGLIPNSRTIWGTTMISTQIRAQLSIAGGGAITGVEHRSGYTTFGAQYHPLAHILNRKFEGTQPDEVALPTGNGNGEVVRWAPGSETVDGVVLDDMHIVGSYIHLILTNPTVLEMLLPLVN